MTGRHHGVDLSGGSVHGAPEGGHLVPGIPRRLSEDLPMPASYLELTLRTLGTTEGLRSALLEGTGITPARVVLPDAEITLGQQLRQLRNANRIFAPGWALLVGEAFEAATHGPLGFGAISAPTLGESLRVLEKFSRARNPSYRIRGEASPAEYHLVFEPSCSLLPEERLPLLETFLLSVQGIVEVILGQPMREDRFEIAAPAPSYSDRYRGYFHAPVRFDCPRTALVIPSEWRRLLSPFADAGMYAASLRKLEGLASRLDGDDYTAARVEQLIATAGAARLPLEVAAHRLGVSRRTLIRRLHDGGTSYGQLSDAHRRQHAEELLEAGSLTAEQIAFELGYQDAANFGRACRRWFGAAPGRLRRTTA